MALTDAGIHLPTDYYTMQPPALGGSYVCPVFGSTVKRVTDAPNEPLAHISLTPEYTNSSPFSLNSKWFILSDMNGYRHLYQGDGTHERRIPFGLGEPRWSRVDPDLLYYCSGNTLRSYNAPTGVTAEVHVFSQFSAIGLGGGTSDISDNNRTTIIGDGSQVLLYDITTDTEYAAVDASGHVFDFCCPTPDGDGFIVAFNQIGPSRWNGVELFDQNAVFQRQLLNGLAHGDVGRDVDGSQVYFQSNAGTNPYQPPGSNKGVVKVRLSDGQVTFLMGVDWGVQMHMSSRAGDGWVYVSTYLDYDPDPASEWQVFYNEVVRVKADGSVIERLAHHRSRGTLYWNTPRAVINIEGDRLLYASDFHLTGQPSDYVDTYEINLGTPAPGGNMSPEEIALLADFDLLTTPYSAEFIGEVFTRLSPPTAADPQVAVNTSDIAEIRTGLGQAATDV